jgi:hypothetical protein
MQKQLVILPVVLVLQNFVDLANPQNVIILRTLFIIVSGLTYLMWQQILQKIEAKRDMTPIWVKKAAAPSLASMFGGSGAAADANAEWLQTTYYEHEKTKASEAAKQLLTGGAMQFGLFSLWMNVQLPLAINLIMGPWGAYDDPIVKQYLLGERIERPYGEVLEDPATAAPATTAPGVADAPLSGQIADGPAATADAAVEETILRTWEAEEPVDVEVFDRLAAAGKPIATHAVASDGWTALMVVAGGPHHPKRAVPRLLELGAVPEAADKDGWTALSWAAFHDNAAAIEAICAHVLASAGGRSRLARLLAAKSTGGETPGSTALEVAQQAKAEAAAAALRRFAEAGADAAAPAAAALAPAAAAAPAPRGRSPSPSRQARAASPAARAASPAAVAAAPEPEPEVFAKVAEAEREPAPAAAAVEAEAEEEEEVSPSRSAGARRRRQQA